MKNLTKEQIKKLPRYVTLGSTALRLINKPVYHNWFCEPNDYVYYREAGDWETEFKILSNGQVVSFMPNNPDLDNRVLKPINKSKYIRDNGGKEYCKPTTVNLIL